MSSSEIDTLAMVLLASLHLLLIFIQPIFQFFAHEVRGLSVATRYHGDKF